MPYMSSTTALIIFLCLIVVAYDILFRRVPNSVLFIALLVHIGYLIATGYGIGGIDVWQSLIGAGIGLIVFIPLYALRAMGAGDVKFLAVLGALLGVKYLAIVWLMGSFFAGVHAVVFHCSQTWSALIPSGLHQVMQQMRDSEMYQRMLNARQGRQGIPYAAYLAVATVLTLGMT